MVFTGRRWLSGCIALVFALWSVLVPVSASATTFNAASNLTGRVWHIPGAGTPLAGSRVVATAATLLGRANPWIAALTLGTPIAELILELKNGGEVGFMTKDGRLASPPSGWADSESPPATVASSGTTTVPATSNPATITKLWPACNGNNCSGAYTADAACAATIVIGSPNGPCVRYLDQGLQIRFCQAGWNDGMCGYYGKAVNPSGQLCGTTQQAYGATCTGLVYSCPGGGTLSGQNCIVGGCPVGYTYGSGACQLTDASAAKWPSDGRATLRMGDNSVYGPHPRDPDSVPSSFDPAEIIDSGPANLHYADPFGQPLMQSLNPTATGGYTFTQSVQTTNNNQTYTTTNNITLNNLGQVVAANTKTTPGTLAQAATANPQGPFPDDYNKEVTQLKILTGDGMADASDFGADVSTRKLGMETELKNKIEAIPGQYAGDKGSWFSWVWTPPVGSCQPFEGDVAGKHVSWDLCPWIAKVRDVIGYVFAIAGTWVVYNELFRREA